MVLEGNFVFGHGGHFSAWSRFLRGLEAELLHLSTHSHTPSGSPPALKDTQASGPEPRLSSLRRLCRVLLPSRNEAHVGACSRRKRLVRPRASPCRPHTVLRKYQEKGPRETGLNPAECSGARRLPSATVLGGPACPAALSQEQPSPRAPAQRDTGLSSTGTPFLEGSARQHSTFMLRFEGTHLEGFPVTFRGGQEKGTLGTRKLMEESRTRAVFARVRH